MGTDARGASSANRAGQACSGEAQRRPASMRSVGFARLCARPQANVFLFPFWVQPGPPEVFPLLSLESVGAALPWRGGKHRRWCSWRRVSSDHGARRGWIGCVALVVFSTARATHACTCDGVAIGAVVFPHARCAIPSHVKVIANQHDTRVPHFGCGPPAVWRSWEQDAEKRVCHEPFRRAPACTSTAIVCVRQDELE